MFVVIPCPVVLATKALGIGAWVVCSFAVKVVVFAVFLPERFAGVRPFGRPAPRAACCTSIVAFGASVRLLEFRMLFADGIGNTSS